MWKGVGVFPNEGGYRFWSGHRLNICVGGIRDTLRSHPQVVCFSSGNSGLPRRRNWISFLSVRCELPVLPPGRGTHVWPGFRCRTSFATLSITPLFNGFFRQVCVTLHRKRFISNHLLCIKYALGKWLPHLGSLSNRPLPGDSFTKKLHAKTQIILFF